LVTAYVLLILELGAWPQGKYSITVKAGGAVYLLNGMVTAAADLDIMSDRQILHLGAEVWLVRDVLALRSGLQNTDF